MKAVIGDKIYLNVTKELAEEIETQLTYRFVVYTNSNIPKVTTEKLYSKHNSDIYIIPVGRQDLIPDGHEIVDKRVTVPTKFPGFQATLRKSQQDVENKVDDNCMINAPPSWGKTFTLLSIAKKLGQKTLVCVHTQNLRDQWISEIKKQFGIEPGVITSGKFLTAGPIVVGNIQSLVKNYTKIKKMFGLLVIDEMHHVSATTFRTLLENSYARYKIGLSGTLKRKDEKHIMFKDLFGPKIIRASRENFMRPDVVGVQTGIELPKGRHWSVKMTQLCETPEYQQLVAHLAKYFERQGHKVLVIGERVSLLEFCSKITPKSVCVTGTTNNREEILKKVNDGNINVLYGSRSIFSEGVSLNSLSCLILAAPVNNEPMLEQLIGRIIRVKEGKKTPLVVDLIFQDSTGKRQWSNRLGFYLNQNYDVTYLK